MGIMTEQERALVETHIGLVETVLQKHITPRPDIPGMEHDDLFQVGSLALCLAAQRYDGRCKFSTFAYVVVKNSLIDHCRKAMGKYGVPISAEKITADGEFVNLLECAPDPQTTMNTAEARELLRTLQDAKQRYRRCAQRGTSHRNANVRLLHQRNRRAVWCAHQCGGSLGEPGAQPAHTGNPRSVFLQITPKIHVHKLLIIWQNGEAPFGPSPF